MGYNKNDINSIIGFCNKENLLLNYSNIKQYEGDFDENKTLIVPDASFLIKGLKQGEPDGNKSLMLIERFRNERYELIVPHIFYSEMKFICERCNINDRDLHSYLNGLHNNHGLKYYCGNYSDLKKHILEISYSNGGIGPYSAELTDSTYHSIASIFNGYFVTADDKYYKNIGEKYQKNVAVLQKVSSNELNILFPT